MSAFTCDYRIYPIWFGDGDTRKPIVELAHGSASRMGRRVVNIEIATCGRCPWNGDLYIDFSVTYSSTISPAWRAWMEQP